MVRSKRKSEKSIQKETEKNISKKSYDQEFELKKLRVLCIIVNRYQGDYFINEFARREVGASFLVYGTGTVTKEIYDIFSSYLNIDTIIITKFDETKVFGNVFSLIYDISKLCRLFLYTSDNQVVRTYCR